tara:strand:- start:684 stop:1529 length:846 start_codon:yes stop_codon:yes gene_type:complete
MDICDKKNQIQDLLNDIFSEYNRINETKIQSKCETDLEMRTMISNIRSLESSSIEKDNRIKCLEKTVCDYEKIIEDLNSRLELKEECDRENNRHDMLRTLSKDISEKDREIKRLNDLLEFHKKEKSKSKEDNKKQKIDNIIEDVKNKEESKITLSEVVEPVNKETGEVNPNFIYEDIKEAPESEPSPGGSIHSSDNEMIPHLESEPSNPPSPVEDIVEYPEKVEPEKAKTLMKVKKDKKLYFAYKEDDPEQDVYEYNEDNLPDKIVGKRTRVNGKWSWKLF